MPTYAYKCQKCNHYFETFQKITDEPIKKCPNCFGKLQKVYFPAGIIFKGEGFYITDKRKEEEKRKSKDKTVENKDLSNIKEKDAIEDSSKT